MYFESLTFLYKSLYFFENEFKDPQSLSKRPTLMKKSEKISIYLEIILKSLTALQKTSVPLKMSSQSRVICSLKKSQISY
jgi:hypothetical protein